MSDTGRPRAVQHGVAEGFPQVQGRCPACRGRSLFLGDGGYVTCSRLDCPDPVAASDLLDPLAGISPAPSAVAGSRS